MNSKIDWYREVLALEPGSRVFFPLAKLLREAGRAEEAVATLSAGLASHPEHLEAKFLLIELLAAGPGETTPAPELAGTLDCLIGVLSRYPAFWALWSEKIAASSRDCALAVRMLAAHLGGAGVDFASLMEKGLAAAASSPSPAAEPAEPAEPAELADFDQDGEAAGSDEPAPPPPLRGADEVRELLGALGQAPVALAAPKTQGGPFSGVRTRTMAEVLAGQGDVKDALDIYEELLAAANAQEKPALAERVAALRQKLSPATGQSGQAGQSGVSGDAGAPDKNKLIGVLEKLAGRLEARADG